MFNQTYTTPEGYTLHKPLLMPDARTFADVAEYVAEWDHVTMNHRNGVLPADGCRPEPRYLSRDDMSPAGATMVALSDLCGFKRDPLARNELGPFGTIDTTQIGGTRRSVAIRLTDAALEAVAPNIVTDDDHLSLEVIVHGNRSDGLPPRALMVLKHGHIIGSHYLAYVDPASLPAYPLAARDQARAELGQRIKAATAWVPWCRPLPGGAMDYGYDGWYPRADESTRLERRGSLPRTRAVEVAHLAADGTLTYYAEGLAHLENLERERDQATTTAQEG